MSICLDLENWTKTFPSFETLAFDLVASILAMMSSNRVASIVDWILYASKTSRDGKRIVGAESGWYWCLFSYRAVIHPAWQQNGGSYEYSWYPGDGPRTRCLSEGMREPYFNSEISPLKATQLIMSVSRVLIPWRKWNRPDVSIVVEKWPLQWRIRSDCASMLRNTWLQTVGSPCSDRNLRWGRWKQEGVVSIRLLAISDL